MILKGQNYQIGTDIFFNILDIQQASDKNGSNEKEFMQYIAREYMNETRIYGIEPHQFKMYLRQDKNKTW